MINIFHRSREFVEKHKQHHHLFLAVLALVVAGTGAYIYRNEIASAATYTWTQADWTGGVSTTATSTHSLNGDMASPRTAWTQYSATSSSILANGSGVSLPTVSHAFTDDGVISDVITPARSAEATGGTVTFSGPYEIHTFTAGGTFTLNGGAAVDFLVVGGGGGGAGISGGGGGGGFLEGTDSLVGGTYPVVVGGTSGANTVGYNSVYNNHTAFGGGKGGPGGTNTPGGSGGSGGGGGYTTSVVNPGGIGTAGQGYNGGAGGSSSLSASKSSGGGGGALTAGTAGAGGGISGRGGDGILRSISGVPTYYAGGAGGSTNTVGASGLGGAGSSASPNGTANTGGGGFSAGTGASGVVILRFLSSVSSPAGGTFGAGANSSTAVTGSGTSASVGLSKVFIATGGTISTSSAYTIHTFTGSGTFVVSAGSVATNVEYLVVGGGGGGGPGAVSSGGGGGGGAGGFRTGTLTAMSSGTFTVTVGAGGAALTNGATSTFSTINSTGGGKGGLGGGTTPGSPGGSGGGGGGWSGLGGAGNTQFFSPSQGNDGGAGTPGTYFSGGGGGGAGAIGQSIASYGGNGGIGATSSIALLGVCPAGGTAPNCYYAGGGGGSTNGLGAGAGGLGGGAAALQTNATPTPGTANTGGGGGANFNGYPAGAGGSGIVIVRYATPGYVSSGTFTSAVINLGGKASLTTLAWAQALGTGTITMKARSSNSPTMVGATDWASCTSSTANTGVNFSALGCVTNGDQYVQYQATLTSTDVGVSTPTLNYVTINYTQYALSGNLTSSPYDTSADGNLVSGVSWLANSTSGTETVKFQVRSSADGITWSNWCGLADSGSTCTGTNYFTTSGSAFPTVGTHPLNSTVNDRYLQYKVFLTSGGATSPVLTRATLQYVVNAPPDVQSVTAVQNTNGTVTVNFDMRDQDTSTGATVGKVNSILQYCPVGSSCVVGNDANWVTASTVTGSVGASTDITASFASSTITWTPTATTSPDYAGHYTSGMTLRIKLDDGEAANRYGYGISPAFTLDTQAPTISAFHYDAGTLTLQASDNANIASYTLANNANLSAGSNNAISGIPQVVASTTLSITPSWTLGAATGTPQMQQVFVRLVDQYGNTNTTSLALPLAPSVFQYTDISNPSIGQYGEFLAWNLYPSPAPAGAAFGSYILYRSTDTGTTWGTISTITSSSTNYYLDTSVASSTSYSYKVQFVTTSANETDFSGTITDTPDGVGGNASGTPVPIITNVTSTSTKSTSVVITWDTNTLANSEVDYGASTSYGSIVTVDSYIATGHSVTLSGLTPNTDYYYRVRSIDTKSQSAYNDNLGSGYYFRTAGGPTISEVTHDLTSNSATIYWNTTTPSDSYVYYATAVSNGALVNPTIFGNDSLVTASTTSGYQHQVGLTGLSPSGATFYYTVRSTDVDRNTTISTNGPTGYYQFSLLADVTPPVISTSTTPVIAPDAAVIVWQTDELATAQLQWGMATSSYSTTTPGHATPPAHGELSIYHVITLSATSLDQNSYPQTLTPETTYHYKVMSVDAAGNPAESGDQSFTTPGTGDVTITVVSVVNSAPAGTTPDTTPPSLSKVEVSDITPFGATVKFGTNEDAVGFVKYGKDTSYGDTASDDTWGTTHTIKFHGLTLGTPYHFLAKAVDKFGNTGTSADQTFTTKFLSEGLTATVDNIEQYQKEIEAAIESVLPSLVPPFVSKPLVTDITESGATVSFKTNIKAFPVVVYADEGSYDDTKDNPYTGEVSNTVDKATTHELALTGLKGNTKYHIQARAFSLPKVIGKSADVTFITKASKIAGTITERKKDSFTVAWTTETPTTSIVEYKNAKTGVTERKADDALRTSHSMRIENLPPGTTYTVNISGQTEGGNIAEGGTSLSVTTSTDTTAPTISGFKVDNALVPGRTDRIQTIVSWTTDEPGNSTVYYEEGAGTAGETKELANKNEELTSYITAHSVILPSLKPGTIYRLKVTSSDDSGNLGSFGPRTVITPQQAVSITDIIFKNFEDSFKFLKKI